MKKLAYFLSYIIGSLIAAIFLIKLIDLALPLPVHISYLFPPYKKVSYKTSEFNAVASINKFGFRGNENELERGQVLAVGDSFVFGWGVSDNETWPYLLQKNFQADGVNLKVYNFGVPGTDTLYHIDTLKEVVPVLKPKYVLLSVLLFDDLQQILEENSVKKTLKPKKFFAKYFGTLYSWYKEISYRSDELHFKNSPVNENMTQWWVDGSKKYLSIKNYPEDIKNHIKAGDINPGILCYGINYPDRAAFWEKNYTGAPESMIIEKVRTELVKINALIKQNGGTLIVVAMPSAAEVNSPATNSYKAYGLNIRPQYLIGEKPEEILGSVGKNSGADFIPLLGRFRKSDKQLFYTYDGHLTLQGNELVANTISTEICAKTKLCSK